MISGLCLNLTVPVYTGLNPMDISVGCVLKKASGVTPGISSVVLSTGYIPRAVSDNLFP